MRSVSYRLADLIKARIPLGFVGENEHTVVQFDAKQAFDQYPTATPSLTVKNPSGEKYPAVVARDGDMVIWTISDSDLIVPGHGEFQLQFKEGDTVMRSYVGETRIERSIMPTGDVPTPVQNWIDAAEDVLEEVEDAIPAGGTQGQVMGKLSDDDYDIGWIDQTGGGGGGGTSNYNELSNKPKINGTTLSGNKSLEDLGAASSEAVNAKYTKPASGIPASDLASGVQTSLGKADTAYQKPSGGVPSSDMASAVQTSLGKADTAYQKPGSGIPASDIADGVIPDVSGFYTKPQTGIPASDLASGVIPDVSGFYTKPATGIPASDLASGVIPTVHNVPAGGSANQVLAKNSGTDYDLKWVNQSGGGGGAEIDDTAGEGDTTVVWSADKTWTETTELKEAIAEKPDVDDTAGIGDTDKAWSADNLGKKFNPVTSTFSEGTENGYYRVTQNGEIEEVSGAFKRSKVEIQPWMGKYVEFSVNGLVGNAYAIYCGFSDENDDFISKNAYVVGSQKLEIPSNAKYIYMSFFGSSYNSDYVVKPNKVIFTNDLKELGVENPFIGKQGVAFGTSLTYRAISDYGYLDFLPGLSGATIDNQGISSAMIGTNILPAVKAYTGYASKDFVIVEGFVNDWAHNVGIGDWNDSTEQTVCGCVRSIINYILSQNNKLTIFFVLDHYGKLYAGMNCSSTAQNTNNLTQYEYYEKIAKVCESLGIPVIKQYAESQICENTPDYLYDQIHPSEVGAKQSANVIWQAMKRYGLRVN